jgi:hypothetical protein
MECSSRRTAGPHDAWRLLEPLVDSELPLKVHNALSEFARRLAGAERFALIEQALRRIITHPVDRSFFEAARLSQVPADAVVELLVQLFPEAHDDAGWRGILNVWQQLSPTTGAAQQRLVDDIYIPTVGKGDAGLDLALQYFGQVAGVRGIRRRVIAAFEAAAHTDDQRHSIGEQLLQANWRRKSLFLGSVDQEE